MKAVLCFEPQRSAILTILDELHIEIFDPRGAIVRPRAVREPMEIQGHVGATFITMAQHQYPVPDGMLHMIDAMGMVKIALDDRGRRK